MNITFYVIFKFYTYANVNSHGQIYSACSKELQILIYGIYIIITPILSQHLLPVNPNYH
jgi:hypothetical protein